MDEPTQKLPAPAGLMERMAAVEARLDRIEAFIYGSCKRTGLDPVEVGMMAICEKGDS